VKPANSLLFSHPELYRSPQDGSDTTVLSDLLLLLFVVKLTDLGAVHQGIAQAAMTQIGTPDYMAPDVFSGLGYFGPADIWGVGRLLWDML
jgi:serine/threonine protein kinase